MEYGEYELVKKSNSGEEVLQTFKGITAEDKGIEAFIEYCSTHPEDDQWGCRQIQWNCRQNGI